MDAKIKNPVIRILNGLSQIMLQDHPVTGILFLLGIMYGSVYMALAALLASITGVLTAQFLKFDPADIFLGFYGFNASLFGVACLLFFKPIFITWVIIIIGSVITTLMQHFFMVKKLAVYTLPFVLVTWAFVFLIRTYWPEMKAEMATTTIEPEESIYFVFRGYGQVIFQSGIISGILFFLGVFTSKPIAALYGLAGAVTGSCVGAYLQLDNQMIYNGLLGFNATLCAITFAGDKFKDGLWVLIAVMLSIIISVWMITYGYMQLTFPFVLAAGIITYIRNLMSGQMA